MSELRSLSVIIPAYNEAGRVVSTIERIIHYCGGRFDTFEIIVVDDGSVDATAEIVSSLKDHEQRLRLERFPANRGKGAAVRAGMLAASSDILLMCDADMSAPIEEMEKLLPWIDRGKDVVFGSRALKDSNIIRQPLYRHLMGKVFGMFARVLALHDVRDPQCGFKLFTRKAARDIFRQTRIDGFAFDVEALLLARKFGWSIKEVGIFWSHSPQSRVRLLTDSFLMAVDLCRILYYDMRGFYDPP